MKEKLDQDLNNCPNKVRLLQEMYFAVDCETSHLGTTMNDNILSDILPKYFLFELAQVLLLISPIQLLCKIKTNFSKSECLTLGGFYGEGW